MPVSVIHHSFDRRAVIYVCDVYFNTEQKDGTPFAEKGADKIKDFMIKTIVMSLVAIIISVIVRQIFKVTSGADLDNGSEIVTGIVLILVSVIFRYGAELERNKK